MNSNLDEFQKLAKTKLLDISACKCSDLTKCKSSPDRRVSLREHKFLLNERTGCKMAIGTLDVATTQKIRMTHERRLTRINHEYGDHQEPLTSKEEEISQEETSPASSDTEDKASTK